MLPYFKRIHTFTIIDSENIILVGENLADETIVTINKLPEPPGFAFVELDEPTLYTLEPEGVINITAQIFRINVLRQNNVLNSSIHKIKFTKPEINFEKSEFYFGFQNKVLSFNFDKGLTVQENGCIFDKNCVLEYCKFEK